MVVGNALCRISTRLMNGFEDERGGERGNDLGVGVEVYNAFSVVYSPCH